MGIKLAEFVSHVRDFAALTHADKIRLFAWFLHFHEKRERFAAADLGLCFQQLSLAPPSGIRPFLIQMEGSKPKQVLRDARGWYLEHTLMQKLSSKYAEREITIQVSKLLETLPNRVPDHAEREFLDEALICYRRGAFRAAVVMTWNLVYWHLCQHILAHKLTEFNGSYVTRFPGKWQKAKVQCIRTFDEFSVDLLESEVLEIAKTALILTNDRFKILTHALGKRNSAAHPSSVKIEQLQAESIIDDLVKNIVLVLPL